LRPVSHALLRFLLEQTNPVRVTVAREELALTASELTVALRSLERSGLARRSRSAPIGTGLAMLRPHLFIEATETARVRSTAVVSGPAMRA
jgi:hypothetical protein